MELARARVPELVLEVLRVLQENGKQAFLAGGAVRDLARLALGQVAEPIAGERWPADFDVATDALPEQVMKIFPRTIPTGIQHGTVTVLARGGGEEHKIEVTTFRGEGAYLDGRRPSEITFLGDIEGDLARRDFTVNAMAWDPLAPGDSGLRDPFGGLGDLRRRRLRAVGVAHHRFAEDGLRPLRAVRLCATLRLALERKTGRAIGETLATFSKVARERVQVELTKLLLRGAPPSRGARLLLRTGLLASIAPPLVAEIDLDRSTWRRSLRALDASPDDLLVRLTILFLPVGPALSMQLCDSLKFPPRLRDRLGLLQREHALPYMSSWSDADCRRALARIGRPELPEFFALRRALAAADQTPSREEEMIARFNSLLANAPPLTVQELAVDGRALMNSLSLQPGPQVGTLLRALLDRVLDDPSLNTADMLTSLSSDMLRRQSTGNPHP